MGAMNHVNIGKYLDIANRWIRLLLASLVKDKYLLSLFKNIFMLYEKYIA